MRLPHIPNKGLSHKHDAVEAAQALAIEALGFLASDPERLGRFLDLAGLGPVNLRAAAADPGFLEGVLDHFASDEALLLDFAQSARRDPAAIIRARQSLSGVPPWQD